MIIDPDFREIDEPIVAIEMGKATAEQLTFALSDLLCWCNGFMAARPDDSSSHPMGVNAARELNIALKRAIEKAEK